MKKLVSVVVFACSAAFADVSFGVDAFVQINLNGEVNETGPGEENVRERLYQLSVYPSLILEPAQRLEVVPVVGFDVTRFKRTREDADGNETTTADQTDWGTGGGCGVFLRIVDENVFRLSLGPDVRLRFAGFDDPDDHWSFATTVAMPLNTDFIITNDFFFRMSPRLAALTYTFERWQDDNHSNTFNFTGLTSWDVHLGFFWTF
jgi:hypothetical protein